MEKKNSVAIWLGCFKSKEYMKNYTDLRILTEEEYDDPSATDASVFARRFEVEDLVPDLLEPLFFERRTDQIDQLIKEASYGHQFVKTLGSRKLVREYNVCITALDHEYDGHITTDEQEDYYVDFIGNVSYDPYDDGLGGITHPWELP